MYMPRLCVSCRRDGDVTEMVPLNAESFAHSNCALLAVIRVVGADTVLDAIAQISADRLYPR